MREYLRGLDSAGLKTPAYYLDLDSFEKRVRFTAESLPGIPLTYSIKANPFLLAGLPAEIRHVEVCSPGELDICRARKIPGKRIIYSGVTKEAWDIREAMAWGADLVTAESLRQAEEEAKAAREMGIRQKTLLRLSSGNQFGMSREDLMELLSRREDFPDLDFYGIHYYSGTQKRLKQVGRDLEFLRDFLKEAKEKHGWMPCLVEMGPGLASDYFEPPYEETERETLAAAAPLLLGFALEYPLGVEMGRFLASECGTYATRVKDAKENEEIRYLICDGGINHLKYYGQNMAMQVPDVESLSGAKAYRRDRLSASQQE